MSLTTILDVAFAVGVLVAAASLAAAAFRLTSARLLIGATVVLFAGSVAAWVIFALHQPRERQLAIAAAGLLACAIAAAASVLLRRALARADAEKKCSGIVGRPRA